MAQLHEIRAARAGASQMEYSAHTVLCILYNYTTMHTLYTTIYTQRTYVVLHITSHHHIPFSLSVQLYPPKTRKMPSVHINVCILTFDWTRYACTRKTNCPFYKPFISLFFLFPAFLYFFCSPFSPPANHTKLHVMYHVSQGTPAKAFISCQPTHPVLWWYPFPPPFFFSPTTQKEKKKKTKYKKSKICTSKSQPAPAIHQKQKCAKTRKIKYKLLESRMRPVKWGT